MTHQSIFHAPVFSLQFFRLLHFVLIQDLYAVPSAVGGHINISPAREPCPWVDDATSTSGIQQSPLVDGRFTY
jgi:hypothetical protein